MSRAETWIALLVLGVGLAVTGILGLFVYMSGNTPLHPSPQDVPSVAAATPPRQWAYAVEQGRSIARTGLAEQNLPGVSVAVGAGGEIVWAEGFGWADLENRVKVAPDTRFRIGTASKALTSAAVALLLERGRLSLDEPIQTYVPEFPEKQWRVTLRALMAHLAGVRNDAGGEEPVTIRCERPLDALQRFADRPLLFAPGTAYRPSTYGWILVSAAVEAAADEPFVTFMRDEVFQPLRMEHTRADSGIGRIAREATSYFPRFAADPRYGPQAPIEEDHSCFAGSGAFLSTPSDLVRFAIAIEAGRLLQPGTVRLLQTSQRLASGRETGYGLGWQLETVALADEHVRAVGHDGTLRGGMVSSLMSLPERGIVVSVVSNVSFADTSSLALRVAHAFADERMKPALEPAPVTIPARPAR